MSRVASVVFLSISYDVYKTKPQDVDLEAVCLADTKRYTLITPPAGTHP
jgi:hypothetical protein